MSTQGAIMECVPNFSEGRDMGIIRQIARTIDGVAGVKLLHIDAGQAANRTVITFAGAPESVTEAAFRAVKTAGQLIDMSKQHGTHPRIGATDVLPLVPVSGITLEECAKQARLLAQRIADELTIPCFCYEAAALHPERRNLAVCRSGEYEGIALRLQDPSLQPDFGARPMDEIITRSGCSVVGARPFLIAVNFNLNTTSKTLAHEIACEVRESGSKGRPGLLKSTKALGWYIDEYGMAQVSMNLTNIEVTPLHMAYCTVKHCAETHGVHVTGTEIIGLVPLRSLLEAGLFFLEQQHRPTNVTDEELINIAISNMGLNDLCPFDPQQKVIEYRIASSVACPLP